MSEYQENLDYAEKLVTSEDGRLKIECKLCWTHDKSYQYLMVTYCTPRRLGTQCYGENWGFPISLMSSQISFRLELEKVFAFLGEKHNKIIQKFGKNLCHFTPEEIKKIV